MASRMARGSIMSTYLGRPFMETSMSAFQFLARSASYSIQTAPDISISVPRLELFEEH